MAYPCLLKSMRSTSTALPARWIGTITATSVEVTSGHGGFTSDERIEELDAVSYEDQR